MKSSIKLAAAALCAILLFSFFSGCKSKQKSIKTSSLIDKGSASSSDSIFVARANSFQEQKVDSNKASVSSKKIDEQSNTLELHFQLDSIKRRVTLDTTGNFDIRKLINAGLLNATSLIIKVRDQQKHTQEESKTEETVKKITSELKNSVDSTAVKKAEEKKDLEKSDREVIKKKDATVATNAGGPWSTFGLGTVAIVCASIGLYFLFKR
ncbi:MAG: hypothetical protein EOO88_38835 [Pedobacter sp.]|nr:MAG: hypothetical protein EOO88_38835 [Pedobacter sp.]